MQTPPLFYLQSISPITPKIIRDVESQWNVPDWVCSWEHPSHFNISQGGINFGAGVVSKDFKIVRVDLTTDGRLLTSWAIPCRWILYKMRWVWEDL